MFLRFSKCRGSCLNWSTRFSAAGRVAQTFAPRWMTFHHQEWSTDGAGLWDLMKICWRNGVLVQRLKVNGNIGESSQMYLSLTSCECDANLQDCPALGQGPCIWSDEVKMRFSQISLSGEQGVPTAWEVDLGFPQ